MISSAGASPSSPPLDALPNCPVRRDAAPAQLRVFGRPVPRQPQLEALATLCCAKRRRSRAKRPYRDSSGSSDPLEGCSPPPIRGCGLCQITVVVLLGKR